MGVFHVLPAHFWIVERKLRLAIQACPVGISLIGSGLHRSTVLFMGWFGPRGLASIVLGLIFLKEEANLSSEELISLIVAATVLLSVFAHGISAAPASSV